MISELKACVTRTALMRRAGLTTKLMGSFSDLEPQKGAVKKFREILRNYRSNLLDKRKAYNFLTMASVSSAPAPGMQQIDLSKLPVPQLAQLKQQLDQEINVIQESLQTLKMAQNKFYESEQSLEKITPDIKGESVLVPLTGSMYVPGTIADTDKVVIDIGTGYYAQKDIAGAKDYFKRKVRFVTEQMEKIQAVGKEKTNIQDTICQLLGMKIQAQRSATPSSS